MSNQRFALGMVLAVAAILAFWSFVESRRPAQSRPVAMSPAVVEPADPNLVAVDEASDPVYRFAESSRSQDNADSIIGRVIDVRGVPIEGARVVALREVSGHAGERSSPTVGGCGPDGVFELEVQESSGSFALRIEAPGFLAARVEGAYAGGPPSQVTLLAAPTLMGRVRSEEGQPAVGASVRFLARTGLGEVVERSTLTDGAGEYRLSGELFPTDQFHDHLLEIVSEGYAFTRIALVEIVYQYKGAPGITEFRRDVILSRGAELLGRVVDDRGLAVEGAEVDLFLHAGRGMYTDPSDLSNHPTKLGPTNAASAVSDSSGSFTLTGVPVLTGDGVSTRWRYSRDGVLGSIRVSKEGYAMGGDSVEWRPSVAPPQYKEITLTPGGTLTGRVVDDLGSPVAGVAVFFQTMGFSHRAIHVNGELHDGFGDLHYWMPWKEGDRGLLWVLSDREGGFHSPVLPVAMAGASSVTLQLSLGYDDLSEPAEVDVEAGVMKELGDQLLPIGNPEVAIVGFVVDEEGSPVPGAEVLLQNHGERRTDRRGWFGYEFRAARLHRGLDLTVAAPGYVSHAEVVSTLPTDPLEIRIQRGRTVGGRMIYRDGSPASGGWLSFSRPAKPGVGFVWSDTIGSVNADTDGRFSFEELPAPPWTLSFGVRKPGWDPEGEVPMTEGTQQLILTLPVDPPEFGSLALRVSDANCDAIEDAWTPVLSREDQSVEAVRRDAYSYHFQEILVGTYRLRVSAPGFPSVEKEVVVTEGEERSLDVVLGEGREVLVWVSPPMPEDARLLVYAVNQDGVQRRGESEVDRSFALGCLAAGTWAIGLAPYLPDSGEGPWVIPPRKVVVERGRQPLEIVLERPELGVVTFEIPVIEPEDPPLPPLSPPGRQSGRAEGDYTQMWWNAYYRSRNRARKLTVELRDGNGETAYRTRVERIVPDDVRQRVTATIAVTAGSYWFILRRGDETLRSVPCTVKENQVMELDP